MSSQTLSHILVIIILCVNLMLLSCHKISNANTISKRNKRQFHGGDFGFISVPFFNYAWGKHYNEWSGPYGWGMPWHFFRPRYGVRRRFWRRRWESSGGFHDGFGFHGGFDGP
ncbi:hypothetical protein WUBG_14928 [Wuchereria bancrofti]|uniref:Uncharacterized protein n=1 Tax=Wuchereria bancrofti TaxID=6293 RepID=J9DWU4_WUCBA|nr:hypothetical protein WUBG_14928 [Wuchereria bancrofti]VDM13223.1 unnamed protein product [Wuchereria bancrofti]